MAQGFCCVAGVTERDHRHVRPVLGRRLPTSLLAPDGPFDFGAVVDLGRVHAAGHTPPEVEDHLFDLSRVRREGYAGGSRIWQVLNETASDSLYDVFGPDLEHHGERASVAVLQGSASLGVYRPLAGVDLFRRERDGRASLRVRLPAERLDLSLTDARYYADGFQVIAQEREAAARERLKRDKPVLLGVGLTRPFASDEGMAERHWLQVTALHFAGEPALRLQIEK